MDNSTLSPSFDALKACYNLVADSPNATAIDLMNQAFILQDGDGNYIVSNTLDVDRIQTTLVTSAAVFAAQLGAALAIAVVLMLMTTSEKRKSLPFIFNILALICDVIRCALQIAQLNGGLSKFPVLELAWFTGPEIGQAIAVSIAGAIMTFLLFVFIELALITQVRVVCAAASSLQRSIVTWFTVCICLLAVAFRMNLLVLNIHSTTHVGDVSDDSQAQVTKAQNMSNISAIVSICIFSAIFCFKLAMAIKSRRAIGLKQFGPMQIIFIMGCQTLVLPAIFAILAYYVLTGTQVQSVVETIVAIFLPLSSIWASANTNARLVANNHAAIMALPEYKPKKEEQHTLGTADTLVESAQQSDDGLLADERRYRSKYDTDLRDLSGSVARRFSGRGGDIEMQHPATRTSPYGKVL